MSTLDNTIDTHCVEDFLPNMPQVRGITALAQRLLRRLQTPRGRFFAWPDFGTDLREFLLANVPADRVASAAAAEADKDEQVESVDASATYEGRAIRLVLTVTTAAGPFDFTMSITDAAVRLIALQQAT
jgi:phage baseplate assembly protein W